MTMTAAFEHRSVLRREAVEALRVERGGRYVDCTLGLGGHAAAILEESAPGGRVLGIDADPEAIRVARANLKVYSQDAILVNANFRYLEDICTRYGFRPVNGVLFDLGLCALHVEAPGRGFSFRHEAPLDMRLGPTQTLTAADIVNRYPEAEFAALLERYGEEPRSRQIARRIVQARPLRTTLDLARAVEQAGGRARGRIHPATRTFQALRIAVNEELESLEQALGQAVNILGSGGRMVVISFHSLEDRLVKSFLRRESQGCLCLPEIPQCVCGHVPRLKLVTRSVIRPTPEEIQANPRSRSARMRVAERIG